MFDEEIISNPVDTVSESLPGYENQAQLLRK